ncbi:MAG: hypothetical protein HN919_17520 [Verrucomicrobia bacterium]|jgi:uncharacterized repeat protein (TIGR04138 family)|nr:hypothetical protein [Verrucomicrobiota bacterium]MBT7068101.1 hypothetical protein [Verrucomicrobiota bacterium]MBT7700842.1 hypothetical protein [Verrucomicrobiota bacterium]
MHESEFSEAIDNLCTADPRYHGQAYYFIREALDFAVRLHKKRPEGTMRHVSASEFLEGFRLYALQEFGPMALTVLGAWGLRRTEDVGEVVFNLVASGKLGKTESDRKEDFAGGFDFTHAFSHPFEPRANRSPEAGVDAEAEDATVANHHEVAEEASP